MEELNTLSKECLNCSAFSPCDLMTSLMLKLSQQFPLFKLGIYKTKENKSFDKISLKKKKINSVYFNISF